MSWSTLSAFPVGGDQMGARRRSRSRSRKVRRAGMYHVKAGQVAEMEKVAGQVMKAGQEAEVKAGQMESAAAALKTAGRRLKKTAKKAKKGARRN